MATVEENLKNAYEAIEWAQAVRSSHASRTKKDSPQRRIDVKLAKERLRKAMKPIHKRIAKLPYMPPEQFEAELRQVSRALQRERRKLWKLIH